MQPLLAYNVHPYRVLIYRLEVYASGEHMSYFDGFVLWLRRLPAMG